MLRQARLGPPGALHHIICRGIERRDIFQDDVDRDTFVDQLGHVLIKSPAGKHCNNAQGKGAGHTWYCSRQIAWHNSVFG